MEEYKYRAFISYRHNERDSAVAKKLHTLIENYSVPSALREKIGSAKMGRVFRDEEELPLSKDLGSDIYAALDSSEWLIVIASPDYLESKWCNAELDYFISIGRRENILTILTRGEPSEAFPQQLRFIEKDGAVTEVEPLAGDVRGSDIKESLKKLENEKYRILAPMLGVEYDDLIQRARRRRIRLMAQAGAAAFALMAGFLVYAVIKNRQITAQRNLAMDNQMKLLIEQANISTVGQNKSLAIKQLLEASDIRPTVGEGNDDRYKAALEYALYTGDYETIMKIDNDNRRFSSLVFSNNDDYLLGITNLNSACLIDASTGKIVHTVSRSDTGQLDSVGFTDDDKYFYMVDSWFGYVTMYETRTGKLYRQFDDGSSMAWQISSRVWCISDHEILIPKDYSLVIWDYEKDKTKEILPLDTGTVQSYTRPLILAVSPDRKTLAVGSHGYGLGMYYVSMDDFSKTPLEFDPNRGYNNLSFSEDGRFLCATSGSMYRVWDREGRMVLSGSLEEGASGSAPDVRINADGSVLMVMTSDLLRAIDTFTGETLWEKTTDSIYVTEAQLSPNGKWVSAIGGINGVFDIYTGETLHEVGAGYFSHDSSKVICDTFSSIPLITATPAYSTVYTVEGFSEELYEEARYTQPKTMITLSLSHNAGEFYTTPPTSVGRKSEVITSPDLRYAAATHMDGFIEVFDISDPANVRELSCVAEHCYDSVNDVVFHGDLMASCGGYDARCAVFDVKRGTMLHVLLGEEYCYGSEFSPDGDKIIILCGYRRDKAFVYSVQTGNLLYSLTAPDETGFEAVGFTKDGTKRVGLTYRDNAAVGTIYPTLGRLIEEAAKR